MGETTREQWLAERQNSIGASESPAALGQSPYRSPYQLWAEKTGLIEPADLSNFEPAEWGLRCEPIIADSFSDRTGRRVTMWLQHKSVRHPLFNWISCTPDAIQVCPMRGEGLLQIKITHEFNAANWKDGPPLYYQIQLQHEMAVMGMEWGTLVVLIGGQRLRYFDCWKNTRFIDTALLPKLEEFWRCVCTRTPPMVDGSIGTAKVLAALHPDDSGETVALTIEADTWAGQLASAKEARAKAEAAVTEAANHIKAAMGAATYGVAPNGTIFSWKTQDGAHGPMRVLRIINSIPN